LGIGVVNHFLDTDFTENTEKEPILKAFPCHPCCPCPRTTATPREPKFERLEVAFAKALADEKQSIYQKQVEAGKRQ